MCVILKKYHGLGNDYIIVDPNKNKIELNEKNIKLICDRNFGVGSDGILYGPILKKDSIEVKIYNPDGSEAEKSGNGVRIFSKYLLDEGYVTSKTFVLTTLGGDVEVEYKNNKGTLIKVAMGKASFNSEDINAIGAKRDIINEVMKFNEEEYRVTCVSIGNPHCVIPMNKISKEKALKLGPFVENSKNFPRRINMQIMEVVDRNNIKIEIYERGAGYTLASGSSSCAAAISAYKLGLVDNNVTVHMAGGDLEINIQKNGVIYMTGEVRSIGTILLTREFIEELDI